MNRVNSSNRRASGELKGSFRRRFRRASGELQQKIPEKCSPSPEITKFKTPMNFTHQSAYRSTRRLGCARKVKNLEMAVYFEFSALLQSANCAGLLQDLAEEEKKDFPSLPIIQNLFLKSTHRPLSFHLTGR